MSSMSNYMQNSMSNYMQKGKSSNFASASTAFASETMTTPTLTRTRSIIPNAPFKAPRALTTDEFLHRDVEQGGWPNVPITGFELRRTNSAVPGSGQVGGFIMGPQAGAMLGIDIPLTAQLCGKTRCDNESEEEESEEEEQRTVPKVGDIYQRKDVEDWPAWKKSGWVYLWTPQQRVGEMGKSYHDTMQPGHKVKVVGVESWPCKSGLTHHIRFESCVPSEGFAPDVIFNTALAKFSYHMELVPAVSSPKKDMTRVVSPSTERMRRSPTPVFGESGEQYTRSRSPTLANLNEALSPRTDLAVSGLKSLSAVLNATDSEGNVDVTALNANTVLNATKENARAKFLQALKDLNDAAENCLKFDFDDANKWKDLFDDSLHHASTTLTWIETEIPEVEEPKRQCTGCLTAEPNQMAHSCLGFASAENTQEEIEPLNRSFTPEPLPVPKAWDIYKRKERVGEPYAWVRRKQAPRTIALGPQVEYMQPGYKVVVNKQWDYECNGVKRYVMFASQEGILCKDLGSTSESQTKYYIAELDDFHKHMELDNDEEEDGSVEQTSGGSMSEQQSRSRLASMDAFQRAQANAKDSNDAPISDKKRKVQDKQDMEEEEDEASTPSRVPKVGDIYQRKDVKHYEYWSAWVHHHPVTCGNKMGMGRSYQDNMLPGHQIEIVDVITRPCKAGVYHTIHFKSCGGKVHGNETVSCQCYKSYDYQFNYYMELAPKKEAAKPAKPAKRARKTKKAAAKEEMF